MNITIDIVSDLVCPWCLIGLTRLEQALEQMPNLRPELVFHPFLLQPTTPREGFDLRDWLRRKYGAPPEQMFARVESAARESGIPLDFGKVARMCNTISAHTLLRHARDKGTQYELKRALLRAYFLEGQDIGDTSVLARCASMHGFDSDEGRSLIEEESERARTLAEARGMSEQGIRGVPFFVFANRVALSGAQPPATMKQAIEQAMESSQPGAESVILDH